MPCSTRMSREECTFRWRSYTSSFQWCHHACSGLPAQALITDLYGGALNKEPDQPQLGDMGDVGAASGLGRTAEQHPAVPGCEQRCLDGVPPFFVGDGLVSVLASDGRSPDLDLGTVGNPGLPAGIELVDCVSPGPQCSPGLTVQPRSVSRGRTSLIAWVASRVAELGEPTTASRTQAISSSSRTRSISSASRPLPCGPSIGRLAQCPHEPWRHPAEHDHNRMALKQ